MAREPRRGAAAASLCAGKEGGGKEIRAPPRAPKSGSMRPKKHVKTGATASLDAEDAVRPPAVEPEGTTSNEATRTHRPCTRGP